MKCDKHTGKVTTLMEYRPGAKGLPSYLEIIIDDPEEPYTPRALLKVRGALADHLYMLSMTDDLERYVHTHYYSDYMCNLIYYVVPSGGSNVPAYAVTQTEDGRELITFGGLRRQGPDAPLLAMDLHDIGRWDEWLKERNIR